MELTFPLAFFLTVVLETTVLFLILRKKYPFAEIAQNSLFVNLISHPIVWFVVPLFVRTIVSYVVTAELFALFSETILYAYLFKNIGLRYAFFISFACNLTSFLFGLIFFP